MRSLNPSRRSVLVGGLAAAVAWVGRPLFSPLGAQQKASNITAEPVGAVPTEPDDPLWSRSLPALIALSPQDRVVPRVREAGASRLDVRALYDSDRLAILIEWKDAHKNTELGTVMQYRDGVAVQFPENPADGPRTVMMGQPNRGVTTYHWKSDWQFSRSYDVDEAYPNMYGDLYQFSGVAAGEMAEATDYLTMGSPQYLTAAAAGNTLANPIAQEKIGPVQKMRAEGFGSIEPAKNQDAQGQGVWKDGEWRIVISVPRRQEFFTFEEGVQVQMAFAAWDGSRSERNGQKAFSEWQTASLGPPVSAAACSVPTASPRAPSGSRPPLLPRPVHVKRPMETGTCCRSSVGSVGPWRLR